MIRVGVDARPLCHLHTGIGQYTARILEQLASETALELYFYSRDAWDENDFGAVIRTANGHLLPNFLHAQMAFSKWAFTDNLDVFWSPRHHLPWSLPCPSVVTIHDLVWLKHPETMTRGGAALERLLMPRAIKKAHSIICVSQSTLNDVRNLEPAAAPKCTMVHEAACVVPSGESNHDEDNTAVDSPFYLFVGTKEPRKNLDRCLAAWGNSDVQRQGYKLVIAGGEGWKYQLGESIERYSLHASVVDLAPSREELRNLYARCHAVVLPAIYEGFGLPLAEAMAFGKPMITSNVSSMPEIAGDAALYVDPNSVDDISAAFRRLAEDKELHQALSAKSAARSKLFSWEKAGKATLEVILEAAQSGRHREL